MLSSTQWSLLLAARAGDTTALGDLCEKYRPAVVGYLRRRGLSEDAEDVAQEVLLALVRVLPKVNPTEGRFRSLVFAITRNLLLKHFERSKAAKRGGGKVQLIADADLLAAPSEPEPEFDAEWLNNLVHAGLARLRTEHPNYFSALSAFVLEGRKQADIAQEQGITPEAARKLIARGKRKLAGYMREEVLSYGLSQREVDDELRHLMGLSSLMAG